MGWSYFLKHSSCTDFGAWSHQEDGAWLQSTIFCLYFRLGIISMRAQTRVIIWLGQKVAVHCLQYTKRSTLLSIWQISLKVHSDYLLGGFLLLPRLLLFTKRGEDYVICLYSSPTYFNFLLFTQRANPSLPSHPPIPTYPRSLLPHLKKAPLYEEGV